MNTKQRRLRAGVFATAAVILLGIGYGFGVMQTSEAAPVATSATAPAHAVFAVDHSPNVTLQLPNFTSIVQKYGPAVVNVKVKSMVRAPGFGQFPGLNPNDPFYYFFHQFQQQQPRKTPVEGIGSGFIIRPDGIILTNAHVVAGAQTVIVTLTDKRQYKAKVLGVDKPTDIAVLKINANHLPTVKIGDPSTVQVGQWAVAIGSPYNFVNTVTAGIVSAKARTLPGEPDSSYVPFIQTDVPVNPGNSGGPLFELNGDVIGINSQIYTGTGGYEGISFAIPINIAMNTAEQLLAHGKVERGRLGIEIQPVTQQLAQAFGLSKPEGALVASVTPGSPGERAGLLSGDVILKFDNHTISDMNQLPPMVADVMPGTKATITIWRNHHERTLDVVVGGSSSGHRVTASGTSSSTSKARLGLTLEPLTPSERAQAHVTGGLVVVSSSGPAAAAGIQAGDIVLALNGQPVSSVEQLHRYLAHAGKHVALLVDHNNAKIFVPVTLG